jgi:hypothetical protein
MVSQRTALAIGAITGLVVPVYFETAFFLHVFYPFRGLSAFVHVRTLLWPGSFPLLAVIGMGDNKGLTPFEIECWLGAIAVCIVTYTAFAWTVWRGFYRSRVWLFVGIGSVLLYWGAMQVLLFPDLN